MADGFVQVLDGVRAHFPLHDGGSDAGQAVLGQTDFAGQVEHLVQTRSVHPDGGVLGCRGHGCIGGWDSGGRRRVWRCGHGHGFERSRRYRCWLGLRGSRSRRGSCGLGSAVFASYQRMVQLVPVRFAVQGLHCRCGRSLCRSRCRCRCRRRGFGLRFAAFDHGVQGSEQGWVRRRRLLALGQLAEHVAHDAGRSHDDIHDGGIQRELEVAQLVEQVLRAMAQFHHFCRIQESGAALDGMKSAEDFVQQFLVVRTLLQIDQLVVNS
ncbi:hypothetical protein GALL_415630 [mine drainage metagenome]|uniref:Uncharacterized protein n=1 Tax=mine drainage metagenome TaxID=410659 RepID=A0A1J5QA21_9ZZZZ